MWLRGGKYLIKSERFGFRLVRQWLKQLSWNWLTSLILFFFLNIPFSLFSFPFSPRKPKNANDLFAKVLFPVCVSPLGVAVVWSDSWFLRNDSFQGNFIKRKTSRGHILLNSPRMTVTLNEAARTGW